MDSREDRFVVEAFDCRPDGLIKPNALMQYLQEAAARHAQQLGLGFADLERRGGFWVLVNFRVEMSNTPRWGDGVMIRTWPSGYTHLLASREFIGAADDGRELFRAATEWMILDKQSGRPKNLSRLDLNLPRTGVETQDFASLPSTGLSRLRPGQTYTRACTISVPFSALDFNSHVNNTEYVRWAFDGLHRRLGHAPVIRSLQGTYLAEVFEGDEIEILIADDSNAPMRILERKSGSASDTGVFLMEIGR